MKFISLKKILNRAAAAARACLPVLFPRHCPVCGKLVALGDYIHPTCLHKLPFIKEPVCFRCGKPVSASRQEYCYDCRIFPKSFQGGRALFLYDKTTRPLMSALKYRNRRILADFFAVFACRRYANLFQSLGIEAVVPVPIHKNKQKKRGYNQAALLGSRIADLLKLSCYSDLLIRTADTLPQKQLSPQARLTNLKKAFRLNPRYTQEITMDTAMPQNAYGISKTTLHKKSMHKIVRRPKNTYRPPRKSCTLPLSTVLLVDDIYTTGATMEACTRVLHESGIPNVYVFSVCIGVSRD